MACSLRTYFTFSTSSRGWSSAAIDVAALLGVERRDAVEEQLVRLRLDAAHELRILARDDRVVAANVLPAVVHADVGVEGLLARHVEGGEAPRLVARRLALLQERHGRRRPLGRRRRQRRVGRGVEAAVGDVQVEDGDQDQAGDQDEHEDGKPPCARRSSPLACPPAPQQPAHQQPHRQRKRAKRRQIPRLVAPEHAAIAERHLRQVAAVHDALAERGEDVAKKRLATTKARTTSPARANRAGKSWGRRSRGGAPDSAAGAGRQRSSSPLRPSAPSVAMLSVKGNTQRNGL